MLIDPDNLRVLIYRQPIDMRKAIDGLAMLVSDHLGESPSSGSLYVFYNRSSNKLKVLYWQCNGFCLFYKRLEKDRFKLPHSDCQTMPISLQQLRWLLDGLDITKVRGHDCANYRVFY
jgi:transposase